LRQIARKTNLCKVVISGHIFLKKPALRLFPQTTECGAIGMKKNGLQIK